MVWTLGEGRWIQWGYLDNTTPGRTVGEIAAAHVGMISLDLRGDMAGQLRGSHLIFENCSYDQDHTDGDFLPRRTSYDLRLAYFSRRQVGEVVDISGADSLHVEWCSRTNGFCRFKLDVLRRTEYGPTVNSSRAALRVIE